MVKPEKAYLCQLLAEAQEKFQAVQLDGADLSNTEISYLPTKQRFLAGLRLGLSGQAEMRKYKLQERNKLRSGCRFYLRMYRAGGKLLRIDDVRDSSEDWGWAAQYDKDVRWLIPILRGKKSAASYMVVTRFREGVVAEEYQVRGNQIVYEAYAPMGEDRVDYYLINYVPTGKYPVLGEEQGYFTLPGLEYTRLNGSVWYQERK